MPVTRRPLLHLWKRLSRRGRSRLDLWGRCLVLMAMIGAVPANADVTSATYTEPTTRYGHGILGDAIEYGALRMVDQYGSSRTIRLPVNRVFEDIAPRLVDVDGDGDNEVIVIETHMARGASLAIYDTRGKIAATPHIGRSNRWLAPIGAVDLDGDGLIEIAYIDRPHLAKRLRVWRFEDSELHHVADLDGLTNHRIGQGFISGGIRDCGDGPEMVTADGNWSRVMASALHDGRLVTRELWPFQGPASLTAALSCE